MKPSRTPGVPRTCGPAHPFRWSGAITDGCHLGAVPCPQQVPGRAGVLAWAAPGHPVGQAPVVPSADRRCVTAGRGNQRTLTPKPRCPSPATPQPSVPLLGFVSGETRQIQLGPPQPVCRNSPLPCALPPTPQGPAGSHPQGSWGPEVPRSTGTGWRSCLAGGGRDGPGGGGRGHWEGSERAGR